MSDTSADHASQPPSDEQRLAVLEHNSRLNRILLIVLGVALIMVIASWSTWGLVSLFGAEEENVSSQVATLQSQLEASAKQLENLQAQLDQLRAVASSPPPPATAAGNDSQATLPQIASVLIAQEQSFQHSLGALKAGMRDLAGMIAGSRSWLDDYNEALDKSLRESQERINRLQRWASGAEQAPARP